MKTERGERRQPGRPAVGRTEPLERDEIVTRALQIIRAEGRDALSMRRLSKELGVTPMAIYHHVADKPALMSALIDRVWDEIVATAPSPSDRGPIEYLIAISVRTREVWLENSDLAVLATAVAEMDESLLRITRLHTAVFEAAGFPDVPLAYSAVQNFTMGSIQTAASRRTGSAYFGRDPDATLAAARRALKKRNASENQIRLTEARFNEGDDRYFEPALRALITGLLAG